MIRLKGFTRPKNRKLRYTTLEHKPRPPPGAPRARSGALFRLMELPDVPLFRILSFPETLASSFLFCSIMMNWQCALVVVQQNNAPNREIAEKRGEIVDGAASERSPNYKLQTWWVGQPIDIDLRFLRTSGLYPPNTQLRTVADYEAATKVFIDYLVDLFRTPVTDCVVDPAGLTDLRRFLTPHMPTMINVWTDELAELSGAELAFLLDTTPDTLIVRGVWPADFAYRRRALPKELWIQHSYWVSDITFEIGCSRVLLLERISWSTMQFVMNTINQWIEGGHPDLELLVVSYSDFLTEEHVKSVFSYYNEGDLWVEDTTNPRYLDIMLGRNKKCFWLMRLLDGMRAMVHLDEERFAFRVLRD